MNESTAGSAIAVSFPTIKFEGLSIESTQLASTVTILAVLCRRRQTPPNVKRTSAQSGTGGGRHFSPLKKL